MGFRESSIEGPFEGSDISRGISNANHLPKVGSDRWHSDLVRQELKKLMPPAAVGIDYRVFLIEHLKDHSLAVREGMIDELSSELCEEAGMLCGTGVESPNAVEFI